jgi:hypothetical protein
VRRKEESSFSEEKEAKRLLFRGAVSADAQARIVGECGSLAM